MAYLAAITAGSGVPLFVRTKGDLPTLPYPKLASLNGAHFFASSLKAELQSCCNGGAKTLWKCFYDSITLILVSTDDGSCDSHMTYLLELVFNAMVLVVGLQELDSIPNVERLKRDLKMCFSLIDHILEQTELLSPLTRCVDVIACDDTSILQDTLEAFTDSAQSSYGCLLINHHICVATQSWWGLSTLETSLLSLFLSSLPSFTAKDIPVFLPKASNKIAHRLLVFTLLEGVELCVLCDSAPSLVDVKMSVDSYWDGVLDALKGFRGDVTTDKKYKYFTRFYKTVVDKFLPSRADSELKDSKSEESPSPLRDSLPHKICHTYSCATQYKAYGLLKDKCVFIVLFAPSVATFALRKLTEEIFQQIISSHLTAFNIIK